MRYWDFARGTTQHKQNGSLPGAGPLRSRAPARVLPLSAVKTGRSSVGAGSSGGTLTTAGANLGYVLADHAWGHGYAPEAAGALLTWAVPIPGGPLSRTSRATRFDACLFR